MQVYKILIATLKNTLSHSIHNGGQNQKPPERRWCPPKQSYNWIAAKRRINRHDLYGESAAGRLTAQRRAGLLVRKVRFGSADNKYSMKSRFLRLTSRSVCAFWATKRTKESNYITDRIFGLIKRDSVSCLMTFEKTNAIERCTKTQPCICAKRRFIKELLKNTLPKGSILSI